MFIINNSMTKEEYIEFNEYHLTHSNEGKKMFKMLHLLTPIISLCIISIYYVITDNLLVVSITAIILALITLLFSLNIKKIIFKSLKKNINNLEKNGKLPFSNESTIILDDDFIREKTSLTESNIKFESIEKIVESKNALYIYIGAIQAIVIPYRSFTSNEEKIDFLNLLNSKTSKL